MIRLSPLPFLRKDDGLIRWAAQLIGTLQRALDRFAIIDGKLGPLRAYPRKCTLSTLPPPEGLERLIILNEGPGVWTLIYSNSVEWRRATDGSEVT